MEQLQHEEIQRSLGRIEGKLDGLNKRIDVSNGRLIKHEQDLNKLKTGQTILKTKAAIFAAGGALIVLIVFEYVKFQFGQ
jgi:hypothetical protein